MGTSASPTDCRAAQKAQRRLHPAQYSTMACSRRLTRADQTSTIRAIVTRCYAPRNELVFSDVARLDVAPVSLGDLNCPPAPESVCQMTLDPIERQKHENALALESCKEQASERLEKLKHTLTLERESVGRAEKAREVQFLEAGQNMRALNALMWQVPGIAVAVTGGLWYGTSTIADDTAKAAVLGFTAVINALLIIVLWRVRFLFQQNLAIQLEYTQVERRTSIVGYVVVTVWSALLLIASSLSVAAALNPARVMQRTSSVTQREGQQVTPASLPQAQQRMEGRSSAAAYGIAAASRSK
jgi:hypothetical protein